MPIEGKRSKHSKRGKHSKRSALSHTDITRRNTIAVGNAHLSYTNTNRQNITMAKVYEFLATGFQESEAMVPLTVLRRAEIDFTTVSLTGDLFVETSGGVTIKADVLFEDCDFSDATILVLPGGVPGANNLDAHEGLRQLLLKHSGEGKTIAAICAAPMVFGKLGLLKGRKATSFPGWEQYLEGANATGDVINVDGNVITAEGPGSAFVFAYKLLAVLKGQSEADELAEVMRWTHVLQTCQR